MGGNINGGTSSSSKLKKMAMKLVFLPCTSFCSSRQRNAIATHDVSSSNTTNLDQEQERPLAQRRGPDYMSDVVEDGECTPNVSSKNFCSICLEPLLSSDANGSPGQAVFTSQCCHSFHLSCISSNIRHGSMTCPICRAQWTRLPQTLHPPCWLPRNQPDPVIRILDDSISTFRVHRRFFTRTARYDDDDPVDVEGAHRSPCGPRLCFNLVPLDDVPQTPMARASCYYVDPGLYSKVDVQTGSPSDVCSCVQHSISPYQSPRLRAPPPGSVSPWCGNRRRKRAVCLSVRLAPQQPVDLVLVASPNGPHLRLLKQCMSLAVCSLRAVDRLAIVSYSSAAARAFPLRRMTSCGKRAALQVIDRLFYAGHADPVEGIKKGIKILKDRAHKNPHSFLLHLSDYPTGSRSYQAINDVEMGFPVSVHQFHVASTGSIVHELEEFLQGQLLGGAVREVQLSVAGRVVRLGDMRGDEERRVFIEVGESEDRHVRIGYSYTEGGGGADEHVRVGEAVVGIAGGDGDDDMGHRMYDEPPTIVGGRASCVDSWEYHDPYMARRWAKRLHGRHRI